jgi:thioredoxin 1
MHPPKIESTAGCRANCAVGLTVLLYLAGLSLPTTEERPLCQNQHDTLDRARMRRMWPTEAGKAPADGPSIPVAPLEESPMSSELIKHISDASFESDVLQSDKPVLVDYWAEWCGPCKMIAPILDDMAKDYGDRLQITKMNVDENRDVPAKFGIRGIPTLMIFKNGQLAATKVGALSKAQLAQFIDGHL